VQHQLSILELRISGDFELGFIIDHDCQWRRLNMIGDQVWVDWFQHRNVEHWVYGLETFGSCRVIE